ncbi:MAG: carbamoyl phosphate synthase small subunit, partial [Lachnospiraceae bacterium]|nr:carbamoyl phosphate synthase small subunit [Lachnospiraceae bacterium]
TSIIRHLTSLPKHHIVLWDFGAKENILRSLLRLDCDVTVVPATTTCDEILSLNPDGIMLSNGPGDPKENTWIIKELAKLCQAQLPIFGICLGHQLLALANGADTEKLKYGHRGANQPIKEIATGKTYITSQNHGYAVKTDMLPQNADISYINVNDNTCEGLTYHTFPGFSVQFHPEACGGPHDTEFLFKDFIKLMEGVH